MKAGILNGPSVQSKYTRMMKPFKESWKGAAANLSGKEEISGTEQSMITILRQLDKKSALKAVDTKAAKEKNERFDSMDLHFHVQVRRSVSAVTFLCCSSLAL